MTNRVRVSILALAFGAILTLPAVAAAQNPVTVGVKAGVNIATLKFEGDDEDDEDVKSLVGAVAGLFVGQQVNDTIGWRLEGLFSQKGAKDAETGEDAKNKLTYIDVNPLLVFSPSSGSDTRFNLFTGPQIAFNTAAKFVEAGQPDEDFKDQVKSTDFGWTVGAGIEAGRFTADARYTLGLSNIAKNSSDSVKNGVFAVMVGVKLK
jgi:hypothetical protein